MAASTSPYLPTVREALGYAPKLLSPASTLTSRLEAVNRFCRYGELPIVFDTVTYGIGWAISTGRLPAAIELHLRSLDRGRLARLLVDASEHITCCGDVPAWLITRYEKLLA